MAKTMDDLIPEINELARKSKTVGLSDDEKRRQDQLRKEYIKLFRANFKDHLKSIKVVDENGNDVTPKKLKEEKKIN